MKDLYKLDPVGCAILVVDIQDRLMRVIDRGDALVKNAVLLLKTANVLKIPVLATTQYVERIGQLLPEITQELNKLTPLDKMEFDCLANGEIRAEIKKLPRTINTLIVCGVETHICVYQTVVGSILAGYRVWVAADAVSSRTAENYLNGLARIREIGGVVASTEMIIYDLLGKAGTPEFKALLPSLK
ncbi:MAG: isochorismatase family protein [Proteobacteria bacterium]|nr:isochorismatase family protein [Pseudomonadota bacterium]MBU1715886.1 isochorismatase family protein [Pseudomonadota bacterium]